MDTFKRERRKVVAFVCDDVSILRHKLLDVLIAMEALNDS
jgi:hypothetical protein